jgi:transcription antitermination factor NusG
MFIKREVMDTSQRNYRSTSYPQDRSRMETNDGSPADLERLYDMPHWYAVYTCANREKLVSAQFAVRGIEHFLPLYQSVREWTDRRVKVQAPLFPGYLFVLTSLRNRLPVLTVPGVVNLVSTARQPVPLAHEFIEILRNGISRVAAQPYTQLPVGQRVSICGGPLKGLEGTLVRHKSSPRVVISIGEIKQSFLAEVNADHLVPIGPVIGMTSPAWHAESVQ